MVIPPNGASRSKWLWDSKSDATNGCVSFYRKSFDLAAVPRNAKIDVFFDDSGSLWVNGVPKPVGDVGDALRSGRNTLAFELHNGRGVSAINFLLTGTDTEGRTFSVHSDEQVRMSRTAAPGWERPEFDDSQWNAVTTFGDVLAQPWSRYFDIRGRMTTVEERAALVSAEEAARTLPDGLDREPPIAAKVVYSGHLPKIDINGRLYEPLLNVWGAGDPYKDTALIRAGRLGFRLFQVPIDDQHYYRGEDHPYDFSRVDASVRRILHLQPDAYVIVRLQLHLRDWVRAHPDERQEYAAGPVNEEWADEYRGRPCRGSCASRPFRQKAHDVLGAFADYVRAQSWGNRILGIRVAYGTYSEWHAYGMYEGPDTSKPMTVHFRDWLARKYASDAELAAAWGDSSVTLETACVPTTDERTKGGALLDPRQDRKTLDYYECFSQAMSGFLIGLCKHVKLALPGRLAGAYYGYVFAMHTPEGSNVLLDRVLASPAVDFLSNPASYTPYSRFNGGPFAPRTVPATFRRYGKLSFLEDDSRFHHIRDLMDRSNRAIALTTPQESHAAMRRNLLTAFFDGTGLQLNDAVGGSYGRPNAFDDPVIWAAIRETFDALGKAGEPSSDSGNDVAVVISPRERLRCDGAPRSPKLSDEIYQQSILHLHRSGVAFDLMTLEDFLASGRAYPVNLFLNAFYLTDRERVILKDKVRKTSCVWLVAPGSVTENGFDDAAMSDLVGLRLRGAGRTPAVVCDDPSAKAVPGADAVSKVNAEGVRTIFTPTCPKTPEAYRALLIAAGATASVEPGSYFRRHGDLLMFNTDKAGTHVITLPAADRNRAVTELYSGRRLPADRLSVESDGPGTWLFKMDEVK